jgi:hypothetical protein
LKEKIYANAIRSGKWAGELVTLGHLLTKLSDKIAWGTGHGAKLPAH